MGAAFGFVRGGLIAIAFVASAARIHQQAAAELDGRFESLALCIDASDVCAALAPIAVKDAFRESMRDIQKLWDEQLKKKRQPKLEKKEA